MCPRLPPTTSISDRVGLRGGGNRTTTLPRRSKTIALSAENIIMNMLREEEPFFLRGSAPEPVFRLVTSSGAIDELVCILKEISLPLTLLKIYGIHFFSQKSKNIIAKWLCAHPQILSRTGAGFED